MLTALLALSLPGPASADQPSTGIANGTIANPISTSQNRTAQAVRARKAQAQPEPAAQARAAANDIRTPLFKFDEDGSIVPDIRAEAAIIYNPETGQVLWESNSRDQRSIASITKVMTAIVFFEEDPDLSNNVLVQRSDVRNASVTYLRVGERISKRDLIHLMLIASDNGASRALARTSWKGTQGFVARMNEKAQELGLTSTRYADTSGLSDANVSTAYDMARLIAYVSGNDDIAAIMQKRTYRATSGRRRITITSTNHLVREADLDVRAGKTGFIRKAGYCVATLLRLPQGGPSVAVVVLGAKSNTARFWETRHLFNWLAAKANDLFGTPVEAASATN